MRLKLWQDWGILAAAIWLYAAPFVFGIASLSHPATALSWATAVVLMVSASEALVLPDVLEEWVDIAAGAVLVIGPWALGIGGETAPMVNSTSVGLAVIALATSALLRDRRMARAAPRG